MAKSIEPEVKDWFAQALSQHKTKYCIEQGTLNIEIENRERNRMNNTNTQNAMKYRYYTYGMFTGTDGNRYDICIPSPFVRDS